jgi:biotin carboxyl carrier protein
MKMTKNFTFAGKTYAVRIEKEGDSYLVQVDEKKSMVTGYSAGVNTVTMDLDGRRYTAYVAEDKGKKYVAIDGEFYQFEMDKDQGQKTKGSIGVKGNSVVSQMPGLLVKVPVAVGDRISAGTTLAVVEAMKMQNELRSPSDGVVKKINFKEGQQVDAFVPIVELDT